MRVWILGGGTLGVLVAAQLRRELHDVVLIEQNPAVADAIISKLDCNVEVCDGTNLHAMQRFAIDRPDCFIAVTGSDEVNMVACGLVAHAFGVRLKIARVRSSKYMANGGVDLTGFGVDHVINPEIETAASLLRSLQHGAVGEVVPFGDSRFTLRDIHISEDGGLDGVALSELGRVAPGSFVVPIVNRSRDFLVPDGGTRLQADDTMYVFSEADAYERLLDRDGGRKPVSNRRTLILGGSFIGVTVARALTGERGEGGGPASIRALVGAIRRRMTSAVTIIEQSEQRAEELSALLPSVEIIPADIRDEERIRSSDYARHDIVIGAMNDEQANLVGCLYAKSMGVVRAAAIVFHDGYARIARNLGIDVPISLKNAMVSAISRRMRGDTVQGLHTIAGSDLVVMELTVGTDSRGAGTRLRDRTLPEKTLVLSLSRDGAERIPTGDDVLQSGDALVVMTSRAREKQVVSCLCS